MPPSVLQSSIVPLGLVAMSVGGEPPVTKALDFTMEHQRQTKWCWAAVATSIARFYQNLGWSQCRLANVELGLTTCCADGSSDPCNNFWYLDRPLNRLGNLGEYKPAALALPSIVSEIEASRPIGVRIAWSGGGGHFVSIGGYAQNLVDIYDPWYGRSTIDYLSFRTRYQGIGRWTHSYRTKPKGS